MIERHLTAVGAVIESFEVITGPDGGGIDHESGEGEYNGYSIIIRTNKGIFRISGCHDMPPSVYFNGEELVMDAEG